MRRLLLLSLLMPLLPAVDSVQDTTIPLLLRPGLPKGHGSLVLFADHLGPAALEGGDEDYT